MYKPETKEECLSQNIQLFCEANNFSQVDMAAILGVSVSTLRSWIYKRALPDDKRKQMLEKLFDASFDKICSNKITIRFLADHSMTIEDVFPYNCLISATCGYDNSVIDTSYTNSDEEIDMFYKEISPREFDEMFVKYLTYREQEVIHFRYRDGLTLEASGKQMDLTRERVRQIESKALRKLNRAVIRWCRDKKHLKTLEEENIELRKKIFDMQAGTSEETPTEFVLKTPIEDLDFSIRTYNSLKRACINRVKDIVSRKESFSQVRGLGRRSIEEIVTKVESFGIPYEFDYNTMTFVLIQ